MASAAAIPVRFRTALNLAALPNKDAPQANREISAACCPSAVLALLSESELTTARTTPRCDNSASIGPTPANSGMASMLWLLSRRISAAMTGIRHIGTCRYRMISRDDLPRSISTRQLRCA
jgi:hypothetical protein